jgi:hypothetical protein
MHRSLDYAAAQGNHIYMQEHIILLKHWDLSTKTTLRVMTYAWSTT